ncbi:hypothetical protein R6Q59_007313 [Mikania micrantha]
MHSLDFHLIQFSANCLTQSMAASSSSFNSHTPTQSISSVSTSIRSAKARVFATANPMKSSYYNSNSYSNSNSNNNSLSSSSLYEVLGVGAGADTVQVKAAYRRLVRVLHPDVGSCGSSADEFMKVHSAYTTLMDPEKRAAYDRGLVQRGNVVLSSTMGSDVRDLGFEPHLKQKMFWTILLLNKFPKKPLSLPSTDHPSATLATFGRCYPRPTILRLPSLPSAIATVATLGCPCNIVQSFTPLQLLPSMKLWFVQDPYERVDPQQFYGGIFRKVHGRKYVSGKVNYIDMVDSDNFLMHELNKMIQELGYTKDVFMYYHFRVPHWDLDTGIKALGNANDVCNLLKYVDRNNVIDIYTQQAPHGSRFLNIDLCESGSSSPLSVYEDQCLFDNEQTESDDEDYLVDEEDLVHDVEVGMDDFRALVVMEELDDETFDDNEKINVDHDDFDSLSDEDNDPPLKRMVKKARNDCKDSMAMPFYVGQSFGNRDFIRALVIKHGLESRHGRAKSLMVVHESEWPALPHFGQTLASLHGRARLMHGRARVSTAMLGIGTTCVGSGVGLHCQCKIWHVIDTNKPNNANRNMKLVFTAAHANIFPYLFIPSFAPFKKDVSFFNDYVADLNEEPPVEYSYDTIDLNAEPHADVGFESQELYAQQNDYGFMYSDSKQSNPEETYEEKPVDSHIDWETNEVHLTET